MKQNKNMKCFIGHKLQSLANIWLTQPLQAANGLSEVEWLVDVVAILKNNVISQHWCFPVSSVVHMSIDISYGVDCFTDNILYKNS